MEHRRVYTIRNRNRPVGDQQIVIASASGPVLTRRRLVNGRVTLVRDATDDGLAACWRESGFLSWESWRDAAKALHHTEDLNTLAIFRVDLVGDD